MIFGGNTKPSLKKGINFIERKISFMGFSSFFFPFLLLPPLNGRNGVKRNGKQNKKKRFKPNNHISSFSVSKSFKLMATCKK
jgi:hypothetical protein